MRWGTGDYLSVGMTVGHGQVEASLSYLYIFILIIYTLVRSIRALARETVAWPRVNISLSLVVLCVCVWMDHLLYTRLLPQG